ncbi:MAG: hypothetical protein HYU51_00255 [Candidatus Rokubacteria bacterium]|nr:hypothetical protein [Candidatus Rokubacteria bacterium]
MTKLVAVVVMVLSALSVLFVAPVIESGTSGYTQVFQAIGTADGGGGGF